jgi:hypothetical protein
VREGRLREGAGTFIGRWYVTLFGFAFLPNGWRGPPK